MEKIKLALKSRTVWSVVVLFLISGVDGITTMIPAELLFPIQAILTGLATYFRVNVKTK